MTNSRQKGARVEYAFAFPVPPRQLSPNARCHWRVLAKHKKEYKARCLGIARAVLGDDPQPLWKLATIKYVGHFKARKWDDDNLIGSMKYARDAIAAVGIVENDEGFTTLPVERYGYSKCPHVMVFVRKTE